MLIARAQSFVPDERGGVSVWAVVWLLLYLGIGGLAIDITNAYRAHAALQSTADSAALAAAMSLSDQTDAANEALAYARTNMDPRHFGRVLVASDVTFGIWDFATKTFAPGGALPNAVRVITRQSAANGNPVAMNMLHIMALFGFNVQWDVATESIAVRYIPRCISDGFVAQGRVFSRANSNFYNDTCIHGQDDGVALRGPNNHYDPNVQVSMAELDDLDAPGPAYATVMNNLVQGDVFPEDSDNTLAIMDALRDLPNNYNSIWDFMYRANGSGGVIMPDYETIEPNDWKPYTVYDLNCVGQLNLDQATALENVVIIADCRIHIAADMSAGNVVIASSHAGSGDAIQMAAKSGLGVADNCAPGGGVEIYSPGNIHMAAQGDWHGVRIVSGGDVQFTAKNDGGAGISVQAAGDIEFTSSNDFGLCTGNSPGPFTWQYRLVR
jgi:hypothetical protein